MGRDVRQGLVRVEAFILLHRPAHLILNVERHLGIAVLVQHDEPTEAIHHRLIFHFGAACQHVLQTRVHSIRHRDVPATADSFGFLHMVSAGAFPQQLMIHPNPAILEVQILLRQAAELADAHPRFQQNNELVVILGIGAVLADEGHPCIQLLFRQGDPLLGSLGTTSGQLEDERILANGVLVAGHLERGLHHTPNSGDGAVASTILCSFMNQSLASLTLMLLIFRLPKSSFATRFSTKL